MLTTLTRILLGLGFTAERAHFCAQLFTETTRDGVYTHGVNRFPRFVEFIRNGNIDVSASPTLVSGFGALERWDGNLGPGNLNAHASMARAIELSRAHGVGCVALRNTNHWMRAGTYGWQAAEAGVIGICWTNTLPNLPPWGATEPRVGNNPLVLAVPRHVGHLVLDMAMSQFSYGALAAYRSRGQQLPFDGGFDSSGNLTRDPAAIEQSLRPLPTGYWKGSGLAMLLDVIAATTALGKATHHMSTEVNSEKGISQIFLAINPAALGSIAELERIADDAVAFVHAAAPVKAGQPACYPGEKTLQLRAENDNLGIPVEPEIWARIVAMQ